MRRFILLALVVAAVVGVGSLLIGTSEAAPAAQDAPVRLVVFETMGREG